MREVKEIMLSCTIGNILRSILEESGEWFPSGNTSRPEHFQIEHRTKILLMATSQWASMCSDTFEGASLQRWGKSWRHIWGNICGGSGGRNIVISVRITLGLRDSEIRHAWGVKGGIIILNSLHNWGGSQGIHWIAIIV